MGGVGGYKCTCKGPFTEFANRLPELNPDSTSDAEFLRYRQGIITDLMIDAKSINDRNTPAPITTLRPGPSTRSSARRLARPGQSGPV